VEGNKEVIAVIHPPKNLIIDPKLAIGTRFYLMKRNKPIFGTVVGYSIYVTTKNRPLLAGILGFFIDIMDCNPSSNLHYSIKYEVECGAERELIDGNDLPLKLHGEQIYFSPEELKKSLFDKK